jgi:hypothetical protein
VRQGRSRREPTCSSRWLDRPQDTRYRLADAILRVPHPGQEAGTDSHGLAPNGRCIQAGPPPDARTQRPGTGLTTPTAPLPMSQRSATRPLTPSTRPSPASALTPRRPRGSSSRAATRLEEPRRVRQRRRSRWLVACVRAPPGAPLSPRNLRARQDHTHVDQPATEAPVAARDEGPGRGRREIARRRHGLARQERRMPTGHNALTRCTNWAEEPLPLGGRDRDHRRLAGGIRARRRRRTR